MYRRMVAPAEPVPLRGGEQERCAAAGQSVGQGWATTPHLLCSCAAPHISMTPSRLGWCEQRSQACKAGQAKQGRPAPSPARSAPEPEDDAGAVLEHKADALVLGHAAGQGWVGMHGTGHGSAGAQRQRALHAG